MEIGTRVVVGLSALCGLGGLVLLASGAPWAAGGGLAVLGIATAHVFGARRRRRERLRHVAGLAAQAETAAAELETQRQAYVDQARSLAEQKLDLEEKNRELSRLSEAKSQFLASISHELRTPLNAIIGFTELLLDGAGGPLSESQGDYLADIRSSGTHLLRLITDILDYSKLEAGKLQLTQERVDFASLAADAVHMLSAVAQRKGVTVETKLEAGISVLVDPLRLKQVALNLMANAVKFTPSGGRVEVVLSSRDTRAVLSITDTGIGIAPEHHAAIFEPFTQVEAQESRRFEGTGLGLALVKRLLEPMDGTVRVVSIELPREASRVVVTAPQPRSKVDVVVAEDDDATRYMLCRVLAAHGCEARGAANGQRALEALAEHLPDVLVLDLMMPELDGYGVLERLRALPRGETVGVLVFSASEPTATERSTLERSGARVFVKGTVGTQTVVAMVQQLAHRTSPRSAA